MKCSVVFWVISMERLSSLKENLTAWKLNSADNKKFQIWNNIPVKIVPRINSEIAAKFGSFS